MNARYLIMGALDPRSGDFMGLKDFGN